MNQKNYLYKSILATIVTCGILGIVYIVVEMSTSNNENDKESSKGIYEMDVS